MTAQFTLGYALNAFPYEDLRGMMTVLREDAPAIKRAVFPGTTFPVEARFSLKIADALCADKNLVRKVRGLISGLGLRLVTVNGFVPLSFHRGRVKERVYLPAWSSPRRGPASRVGFTNNCVTLLAELMDDSTPFGSVSVPAGVLKRTVRKAGRDATLNRIAQAVATCARHAAEVEDRTGRRVMLGLEPEPGLTCETTAETVDFFLRHLFPLLSDDLRCRVGVNFDLCHQLVAWEDPIASIRQLLRHNIPLTKIHVTNAIQLDAPTAPASRHQRARLREFYADSKFLHQTTGVSRVSQRGSPALSALDLPQVLSPSGMRLLARKKIRSLRIHYHMPLFESRDAVIRTTLPQVNRFLREWKRELTRHPGLRAVPLIIETYTWLEQLRDADVDPRDAMRRGIVRELRAVRVVLS